MANIDSIINRSSSNSNSSNSSSGSSTICIYRSLEEFRVKYNFEFSTCIGSSITISREFFPGMGFEPLISCFSCKHANY